MTEQSDGYHTFDELYHHRAVLFSVVVDDHRDLAWKSKLHNDGTMYDGMFIAGIETPMGQATYHNYIDPYWDMFDCKELERAPEWDGHTPDDAIARIASLRRGTCEMRHDGDGYGRFWYTCVSCGRRVPTTDDSDRRAVRDVPERCPGCGRKVT